LKKAGQKLLIPSLLTDIIFQMGGYFSDYRRQFSAGRPYKINEKPTVKGCRFFY